jgi:serine/threonine protein kinase
MGVWFRVGSPLYMAPEVLFKESGGYDGKADLWSVGCIVFELAKVGLD